MRHGAAAQPSGPAPNRLCAPESSRNPRLQTDLYKKKTGFSFSESGLFLCIDQRIADMTANRAMLSRVNTDSAEEMFARSSPASANTGST